MKTNQESQFFCDMNAIDAGTRERHTQIAIALFQAVQTVQEINDGYAFRLPNETEMLIKAAEFVANERLCCPFFGFNIEVEPHGGPLWLRLTGPEGVKPFIQAEIGGALKESIAQAANFKIS